MRVFKRYIISALALSLGCNAAFAACDASAISCSVSNEAELIDAINWANASTSGLKFIELASDISLSASLPALTHNVVINGNNKTIDGDGYQVFEVGDATSSRVLATINNLTIKNAKAEGNVGADGLGGAVYVSEKGDVNINNVKFEGNSASNGAGGDGLGGSIYVAEGGSLNLLGKTNVGSGTADDGSGLFLEGAGTLRVTVPSNGNLTLAGDIADEVGTGRSVGGDSWNLMISGSGASEENMVILSGNNKYSGDTYVMSATLAVGADENLGGSNGTVILDEGALAMGDGFHLTRDVVVTSGGSGLGVMPGGTAYLDADIVGGGTLEKRGAGNLVLNSPTAFAGDWMVRDGSLVLDNDNRLGNSLVTVDGGGLLISQDVAGLRGFLVGEGGAVLDNGSHNLSLRSGIAGLGDVTFEGSGTTTLSSGNVYVGDSIVNAGTVVGGLSAVGKAIIGTGATWDLGGNNRSILGIEGGGNIALGANNLTVNLISLEEDEAPSVFSGVISGDGNVIKSGNGVLNLTGNNTYTGETRINNGFVLVNNDNNLGSGEVLLTGGETSGLVFSSSQTNRDLTLQGLGGSLNSSGGTLTSTGLISGSGNLYVTEGTLILDNANTYTGNTVVSGMDSLIGLANQDGMGTSGNLILKDGGGLKLLTATSDIRPIVLQGDSGTIDTNGFDATSTGNITGGAGSGLNKVGAGTLTFTGDMTYGGLTNVMQGALQIGNGVTSGSLAGDVTVGDGAKLIFNQDANASYNKAIDGGGQVIKQGEGVLQLQGSHYNLFTGGLLVEQGFVGFNNSGLLGVGPIVLDGGGLLLGDSLVQNIDVAANGGSLSVAAGDSHVASGNILGNGLLTKEGAGQLIVTGLASQAGLTQVKEGELQIGQGISGNVVGDIQVDAGATLAFGRDDSTSFDSQITGVGDVVKRGAGQLIITQDQTYTGSTRIENGSLRLGLGGANGMVAGDVELGASTQLVFDHGVNKVFAGQTQGFGSVIKQNANTLIVEGDWAHTGGTQVNGGTLQIGNGGTAGSVASDITLNGGSRLAFNRSDNAIYSGTINGDGNVYQIGTGTTSFAQANNYLGNTYVLNGQIAADANDRLGQGSLVLNGGNFRYDSAFNDLRNIYLEGVGGGVDTNGFDVSYDNLISGQGAFVKQGAGSFTVTSLLAAGQINIESGDLRMGNGGTKGNLQGDVFIDSGASLTFNRSDLLSLSDVITGSGDIVQAGSGMLAVVEDNNAFTGNLRVEQGKLLLDDVSWGGGVQVNGGELQGWGKLGGDLVVSAGRLNIADHDVQTMKVAGDFIMSSGGEWIVDVLPDLTSDKVEAQGVAQVDGKLIIRSAQGDYQNLSTYNLISASSVSGQFAQVDSDLAFLDAIVQYKAQTIDLVLRRNDVGFGSDRRLTYNQKAVASALDKMEFDNPVVARVAGMNLNQARDAYDELNGDSLVAAVEAGASITKRFNGLMQLRASRMGMASRKPGSGLVSNMLGNDGMDYEPLNWSKTRPVDGAWVQVQSINPSANKDSKTGNASWKAEGQAIAAGVDGYWNDEWMGGLAISSAKADISLKNRDGKGDLDSLMLGVYARWQQDGWSSKFTLAYSQTDAAMTRTVAGEQLKSDYELPLLTADWELGYGWQWGSATMRPYLSLKGSKLTRDGFSERGGDNALTVGKSSSTGGEVGPGVEVSRPWLANGTRWVMLNGYVAAYKPFGGAQIEQRARFNNSDVVFTVRGNDNDKLALEYGAGGEFYFTKQMALWAGVQGREAASQHAVDAVLGVQFRW